MPCECIWPPAMAGGLCSNGSVYSSVASIRQIARATIPIVATAQATGVIMPTSIPAPSPMAQAVIEVGNHGEMSTGSSPTMIVGRAKTANPIAATAAWFETTVEAASTTPTKNAMAATIPTADITTTPAGMAPYTTTTSPTVARSGTTPPTMAMAADPAIHFDIQIDPRETGLEATHARVPWSLSLTSRPIDPKIAATMKICDVTAASKFVIGSMVALAEPAEPSGTLARTHVAMAPLAAARTMKTADTARMTTPARE